MQRADKSRHGLGRAQHAAGNDSAEEKQPSDDAYDPLALAQRRRLVDAQDGHDQINDYPQGKLLMKHIGVRSQF